MTDPDEYVRVSAKAVADAIDLLEHVPFGVHQRWSRDGNVADANRLDAFDERRVDAVRWLRAAIPSAAGSGVAVSEDKT